MARAGVDAGVRAIIADVRAATLDSPGANKYCGPMGRRDNRRSMKMRRRTRQRKLKARMAKKRGAARDKAASAGAAKPAKKKAAAKK